MFEYFDSAVAALHTQTIFCNILFFVQQGVDNGTHDQTCPGNPGWVGSLYKSNQDHNNSTCPTGQ